MPPIFGLENLPKGILDIGKEIKLRTGISLVNSVKRQQETASDPDIKLLVPGK